MGLPAGFFQRLVHAGSLAPSGDNLQPWSFEIDGDKLLLRHDAQRDQSLFNVRQLASFIALGAVVENLAIAATKENFHAKIAYFPDIQDEGLVAHIDFEHGSSVDPLVNYLEKRCTNRKPYARRALDEAAKKQLAVDLTRFPGIGVSWLYDKTDLKKVGQIVAKADRLLFENPLIHGHLFSTIRWNQTEVEGTQDGLPIETLELGTLGSRAFRALRRWTVVRLLNGIGFSAVASKQSAMLIRGSSAAALVTAPNVTPISFMRVGQVLQRLWLVATSADLALQPMTAIVFLQLRAVLSDYQGLTQDQRTIAQSLREDLTKAYSLPRDRIPAMHFRLGYAPRPSATTRRRSATIEMGTN